MGSVQRMLRYYRGFNTRKNFILKLKRWCIRNVWPLCVNLADVVLSTSQMAKYAGDDPAKEFIIGTEAGLIIG